MVRSVNVRADSSVQIAKANGHTDADRSLVRSFGVSRENGDGVGDEGENTGGAKINGEVRERGVSAENEDNVTDTTDSQEGH